MRKRRERPASGPARGPLARGFVDHPSWRGWLRPWRAHLGAPGWLVVLWWVGLVLIPPLIVLVVLVEGYLAWASDWDSIDLAPRELGMSVVACLGGCGAYLAIPGLVGHVVMYGSAAGMGLLVAAISIGRTISRPVFEVREPERPGGPWRVYGRRRGLTAGEYHDYAVAVRVSDTLNRSLQVEGDALTRTAPRSPQEPARYTVRGQGTIQEQAERIAAEVGADT